MHRFILPLGTLFGCLLMAPCTASTITVNTELDQFGADSGHCSLREAVQAANTDAAFGGCIAGSGTDLIKLNNTTYLLTRTGRDEDDNATGDLDISSSMVILGTSAEQTTIDGGGIDRIFHVRESSPVISVSIINLTLRNGDAVGNSSSSHAAGGAIWAERQTTLSLTSVHVTGNRAYQGGGIQADHWTTILSVTNSTLSRNQTSYLGGAIYTSRDLKLTSSTISGNIAGCTASALLLGGFAESFMEASTIVDNHGIDCGNSISAPAVWSSGSTNITHAHNTIIAANYSGIFESNCNYLQSDDYNLLGDTDDCEISGATAHLLTGFDPQFAPLFDYGGTTPTHALYPGSPAIGAGHDCRTTDQRGVTRTGCDIGAYAYKPTFVVNQSNDAQDSNAGDGVCSAAGGHCTLRAAIAESNQRTDPTLIILPAGDYPLSIARVGDDPQHTGWLQSKAPDSVTIFGAGAGSTRVIGSGNDDAMVYAYSGSLALARVSIRGGNQHTVATAGGVASYQATLMLQDVDIAGNRGCHGGLSVGRRAILDRISIHGNVADGNGCPRRSGGGIYVESSGDVDARNVTISDNRAADGGGGVDVEGGIARFVHATIAGNVAGYAGNGTSPDGGGLHRTNTGSIFLKNSIVAGNTAAGNGNDCAAVVQSQNFNLIGNASACSIGGETTGNLGGVDAQLDPLADDGNGLPVRGLRADSPAIDAVGAGGTVVDAVRACRDANGRYTIEDQRGMPRALNQRCDIGAYEGTSDRIFANGFAD
ncbi:MAG: CSLREA domain-containing protein [Dokdonella sp.]